MALEGLKPHDEVFDASDPKQSYHPSLGVKAGEAETVLAERAIKAAKDKDAEIEELKKQIAELQKAKELAAKMPVKDGK